MRLTGWALLIKLRAGTFVLMVWTLLGCIWVVTTTSKVHAAIARFTGAVAQLKPAP